MNKFLVLHIQEHVYEDIKRIDNRLCILYDLTEETFFYYGTVLEDPSHMKFLPLESTVWFGDSGGAVFEDGGKLAGIISSFVIHKGHLLENSATHVILYKEWIDNTIKENK